jgi:hypothetical protein
MTYSNQDFRDRLNDQRREWFESGHVCFLAGAAVGAFVILMWLL